MTALETGKSADRARLLSVIHAATAAMEPADPATRFRKAMDRLGELLAERGLERRYNPQWELQPRVPQGNPGGGQWTNGGGSGGVSEETVLTAAKISPALEQECLEQLERDTFFCAMIANRACHAQAMERYAACLAGRPIPPLSF